MKAYYKKWLSQVGIPVPVTPIEFRGYYLNTSASSTGNVRKYHKDGKTWVAELWLCEYVEDNTVKTDLLKFRAIDPFEDDGGNVGWDYNKDHLLIDDGIDPITCTRQEVLLNEKISDPYLDYLEEQDRIRVDKISAQLKIEVDKRNKVGLFLLRRFFETPTAATYKYIKIFKKSFPNKWKHLMKKLNT